VNIAWFLAGVAATIMCEIIGLFIAAIVVAVRRVKNGN
jgi:hypothetical protein